MIRLVYWEHDTAAVSAYFEGFHDGRHIVRIVALSGVDGASRSSILS